MLDEGERPFPGKRSEKRRENAKGKAAEKAKK
jgi:hypothetical protein